MVQPLGLCVARDEIGEVFCRHRSGHRPCPHVASRLSVTVPRGRDGAFVGSTRKYPSVLDPWRPSASAQGRRRAPRQRARRRDDYLNRRASQMFDIYQHKLNPAYRLIVSSGAELPQEANKDDWKITRIGAKRITLEAEGDLQKVGYHLYKPMMTFAELGVVARRAG